MSAMTINFDDEEPNIGVGELIKAKQSSSSTRREYLRMRAERELREKENNLLAPITEEHSASPGGEEASGAHTADQASKSQEAVTEITSFPFVDTVDGAQKKATKHVEANEHPGHRHGAKLCMLSAVIHMKSMAKRKPKSIKELKKNPITSQQERDRKSHADCSDSDSEPEDHLGHLRKCRYLRGTNEDKELSIEEIFG